MQKGYQEFWRRLGRVEKSFLAAALLYVFLKVSGAFPAWHFLVALVAFVLGALSLIRLARTATKKAIWLLRNRLILAYVFIAVVPIVLILALAVVAGWVVLGQVGVYLVRTELASRERGLLLQADMLAGRRGGPGRGGAFGRAAGARPPDTTPTATTRQAAADQRPNQQRLIQQPLTQQRPNQQRPADARRSGPPRFPIPGGRGPFPFPGAAPAGRPEFTMAAALTRQAEIFRFRYPTAEVLVTGRDEIKVPPDSTLTKPQGDWARTSGLIIRPTDKGERLVLWAHSLANEGEVRDAIIVEPLTKEMLVGLVPKIGDVTVASGTEDYIGVQPERIPPAKNIFDFHVRGYYPLAASSWKSPNDDRELYLLVDTRVSAVMGIILEQTWARSWKSPRLFSSCSLGSSRCS
jgi:hypothetical protein